VDSKDHRFRRLNQEIRNCQRCRLAESRTYALCGEGDTNARLMLIAQAPGDTEDQENRMFIGPSGGVLDILLSTAGVSRDALYMTNLVKCRLPDYRRPKQDEIEACSDYLDREISLVDPEVLVPLGYYATRHMLRSMNHSDPESRSDIAELFGTIIPTERGQLYPLPHPASLIYHEDYWPVTQERYRKLKEFV